MRQSHSLRAAGVFWVLLGSAALLAGQAQGGAAAEANPDVPFVVVLDPAHGGADLGAQLGSAFSARSVVPAQLASTSRADAANSPGENEKEMTLALGATLASSLGQRGITVLSTRTGDRSVSAAERAGLANHAGAAACMSLHATASGTGVHLFTSSLRPGAPSFFQPWNTAQAPFLEGSLRLTAEINSAMTRAEVPVTLGSTSLQPLDNFACPAVAIEIAPPPRRGLPFPAAAETAYRQRVVAALADAVSNWRRDWRAQP